MTGMPVGRAKERSNSRQRVLTPNCLPIAFSEAIT
jgi:hypothetical protein